MTSNGPNKFEYPKMKVESPNVKYTVDERGFEQVESLYEYDHVRVEHDKAANSIKVSSQFQFLLERQKSQPTAVY